MTIALAMLARTRVTVADVNLKLIWDRYQRHPRRRQGLRFRGRRQGPAHRHPDLKPRSARHGFSRLPQVRQPRIHGRAERPATSATGVGVAEIATSLDGRGSSLLTRSCKRTGSFSCSSRSPSAGSSTRPSQTLALLGLACCSRSRSGALARRCGADPPPATGAENSGPAISRSARDSHRRRDRDARRTASTYGQANSGELRDPGSQSRHAHERLNEALQQQTATADVLKVISRSAFVCQAVFETLGVDGVRLCDAKYGIIFRRHGDVYATRRARWMSIQPIATTKQMAEIRPGRGTLVGRVATGKWASRSQTPERSGLCRKDEARIGNVGHARCR